MPALFNMFRMAGYGMWAVCPIRARHGSVHPSGQRALTAARIGVWTSGGAPRI